jgi:tRNA-specific 2-thiouridylase
MGKKVLVAMSGGVDSSTAALLLQQNGYEVTGVTMCLGISNKESNKTSCCGGDAIEDARRVCNHLGIPHYVLDFSAELEKYVIGPFLREYAKGRTPNPCIDCNRNLKFDVLLKKALIMGFDFLATGHYAAIEKNNGHLSLKKPADKRKDQTYFLYPIPHEALDHMLFPLAALCKEEIRALAREAGLPVAEKKESQDICFIDGKDYRDFLTERLKEVKPGPVVDVKGTVVGAHKGIPFYTVGQRTGLGVCSKEPLYVVAIDAPQNKIVVGKRDDLKAKALIAGSLNLLAEEWPEKAFAKIRYRKSEEECQLTNLNDKLKVTFFTDQNAIAPGQAIVFYEGDIVLGGGIIEGVVNGTC